MSDAVTNVTNDTFDSVVVEAKTPVLVDFWATWCGPCKIIAPVVEELAKEYEGKVTFAKVNTDENADLATDENADLASRFNIRGIPTLMFFKEGKMVDQVVGAVPKAQLKSKLDSLLG
jgi:thioredoxin 1